MSGKTYGALVRSGELYFVSGTTASDAEGRIVHPGDIVGQTRYIFEKIRDLLATEGLSLADIVVTHDYIVSREGYRDTAAVRAEMLGPDFPAATGVIVAGLLRRGALIEIDAIACRGGR